MHEQLVKTIEKVKKHVSDMINQHERSTLSIDEMKKNKKYESVFFI